MGFTLSVNTNPFVNRFAEPEDLIGVLADEIGIGHVQLVHEFINPSWDAKTIARLTSRMSAATAAPMGGSTISAILTPKCAPIMSLGSKPWRISRPISARPPSARNSPF